MLLATQNNKEVPHWVSYWISYWLPKQAGPHHRTKAAVFGKELLICCITCGHSDTWPLLHIGIQRGPQVGAIVGYRVFEVICTGNGHGQCVFDGKKVSRVSQTLITVKNGSVGYHLDPQQGNSARTPLHLQYFRRLRSESRERAFPGIWIGWRALFSPRQSIDWLIRFDSIRLIDSIRFIRIDAIRFIRFDSIRFDWFKSSIYSFICLTPFSK